MKKFPNNERKKLFLIAPKKRPDALNATQQTPALYKERFLKKTRKTFKNYHFLVFFVKFLVVWQSSTTVVLSFMADGIQDFTHKAIFSGLVSFVGCV